MIYIQILIGHFIGDWLLQNTWINVRKQRIVISFFAPVFWLHILIITLTIGVFTSWWDWRLLLVAASHAFIDYIKYPLFVHIIHNIYRRSAVDQFLHLLSYFLIAQLRVS